MRRGGDVQFIVISNAIPQALRCRTQVGGSIDEVVRFGLKRTSRRTTSTQHFSLRSFGCGSRSKTANFHQETMPRCSRPSWAWLDALS